MQSQAGGGGYPLPPTRRLSSRGRSRRGSSGEGSVIRQPKPLRAHPGLQFVVLNSFNPHSVPPTSNTLELDWFEHPAPSNQVPPLFVLSGSTLKNWAAFPFFCFFLCPHRAACGISLTRSRTRAPAVEAQSLNHWATREVQLLLFKSSNHRGSEYIPFLKQKRLLSPSKKKELC